MNHFLIKTERWVDITLYTYTARWITATERSFHRFILPLMVSDEQRSINTSGL